MAQATRPWGDEIKARVRVAMEYGDRTWDEIADAFGASTRTVQRWLHEDSVSGEARREKLAQMCGVPDWFMERGFETPAEGDRALRIAQMAGELAALQRRVEELTAGEETP